MLGPSGFLFQISVSLKSGGTMLLVLVLVLGHNDKLKLKGIKFSSTKLTGPYLYLMGSARHQQHLNFSCISLQVHTKAQQTWTKQLAYWWLLNTNTFFQLQYYLRISIIKKVKFNKSILLIQIKFATNTSICLDGDKRHSHSK